MYISEGIPFGFTSAAIVAYLRSQGFALDDIGLFVAALFLPWSFKWAWAPLVDLFRFNHLGGRKAWIVACTVMMVLTLSLIQLLDVADDFRLLLSLVVFHNIFAATQDVAIDSLAVSTLEADERARGNGFMFGGQYVGIGIGGAGSIALFGMIGFDATLAVMCVLLTLNLLFIVLFIRDPEVEMASSKALLGDALRTFFLELKIGFFGSGRGPLLALAFSVLPVGAIALAYATLSTIQVDFGLDQTEIATVTAMSTVLGAIGCMLGGFLGDRFGLRQVLFFAYCGSAIPTLFLAFAISSTGLAGMTYATLVGSIAVHGLIIGLAFGAHAAVFMGVANPAVGATMFTAFMAMSNLAISYTNFWQGQVGQAFDYAMVLYIDAAMVLIPLCLIPFLRNREERSGAIPVRAD
jgi:PAT family beta-lactamase induction signal transducer AmpG